MNTLSQRGLASRLELDVSTIRRRGREVVGYARNSYDRNQAHKEIWHRHDYSNGRLMYYKLTLNTERPPC